MVRTLAKGLANRGLDVHVATTDDNDHSRLEIPLGVPVVQDGVSYLHFPRQTRFYTCSFPLRAWLGKHLQDYDVAHIHALFSYASTTSAWIAAGRRVPYIIRPLGILNRWGMQHRNPLLKKLSFRLCERKILECAAAVHYTSEQEQIEAEELGFRAPAVVIPNPVEFRETAFARGRLRARYPQLEGKIVYLFLSRVDAKKGLDLLLPAFARLRVKHPEAALVIAGSGPAVLMRSLRALAAEHSLEREIIWAGFLEGQEKWEALSDADVFVLPSYSENFGVAAVEAMGVRVPVVVSDQVGIHRQIVDAGAGLVTSCAVASLADALARMAEDPAGRIEMGIRGAQLARSEFSLDAVCAKLFALYHGAVAEGR